MIATFDSLGVLASGMRPVINPVEAGVPRAERRSIKQALLPLFEAVGTTSMNLRADSAGFWRRGHDRYWLPRVIYRGASADGEPPIRIGIFAGVHGDEPAGVLAILDFLRFIEANPVFFRAYRLHIYPLCNPTGFEDGTRTSRSGKDLNREFWRDSDEPEVQLLEQELRTHRFDGLIALHSDDTSDGLYGFVRGHTLAEHLLRPALAAAEKALPVNRSEVIDGFHAVEGIIHTGYDGILSAPREQTPAPFEMVLESPTLAPMEAQREAFVFALTETLREYRRLISFAQDI